MKLIRTVYASQRIDKPEEWYFGKHDTDNPNDDYCGSGIKMLQLLKDGVTFRKFVLATDIETAAEQKTVEEWWIAWGRKQPGMIVLNISNGSYGVGSHAEASIIKMSNAVKGRVRSVTDYETMMSPKLFKVIDTTFKWINVDGRTFEGTPEELYRKDGSKRTSLCKVAAKVQQYSSGWFIEGFTDRRSVLRGPHSGETYNWIHKDGRTFLGTIMELVNEFPKDKLDNSSLSKIAKGIRPSHKKWRLV